MAPPVARNVAELSQHGRSLVIIARRRAIDRTICRPEIFRGSAERPQANRTTLHERRAAPMRREFNFTQSFRKIAGKKHDAGRDGRLGTRGGSHLYRQK